jgi:hypothetical protein
MFACSSKIGEAAWCVSDSVRGEDWYCEFELVCRFCDEGMLLLENRFQQTVVILVKMKIIIVELLEAVVVWSNGL